VPRRSGKKKPSHKPSRYIAPANNNDSDTPSPREVIRELMTNKPGAVGFLLSLLQLAGHATWIGLVWYLSVTGKAEKLSPCLFVFTTACDERPDCWPSSDSACRFSSASWRRVSSLCRGSGLWRAEFRHSAAKLPWWSDKLVAGQNQT
jgi:hypothetical protein